MSTFRRTISLSKKAEEILIAHAEKSGMKISTVIEKLLLKLGEKK